MPIATLPQHAFTAGEWSPRLFGRSDLQKYGSACSVLENMTIMPHGALTRRMGTQLISSDVGTEEVRLINFVFNTEQAYVLELTPQRMRFYRDAGRTAQVLATPWTADQIRRLQTTQSADVMYFVCSDVPPHKLMRTGADVFELVPVAFTGAPAEWSGSCWPSAVTFHQQRLWLAGTPNKPQSLWASCTANFEDFTSGTDDTSGLAITLAADQVNAVRWMISARALLVGTLGGEWMVSGTNLDGPITSKTLNARRNSNYGTSGVSPLLVGTTVVHASGDRARVRELGYSLSDDGYISTDLSLLGEHITCARVRNMAYAPDPDGIVWTVQDDGSLAGLTYMRAQDVIGWHRHPTRGKALSVATIPAASGAEVWLAVKRAHGVCIERVLPPWDGAHTNDPGCWFVDSGLQYSGPPVNEVSGLEHLEGCTVSILADGATHPARVVREGAIELDVAASLVTIGLPCPWQVVPMMPEGASHGGTSQGKKKRLTAVTVRTYKTLGMEYGVYSPEGSSLFQAPDRDVRHNLDAAPLPYTGDVRLPLPDNWSRDGRYILGGRLPLPASLVLVAPEITTYE